MPRRLDPDWRKAPYALVHAPPLFAGCLVAALLVVFAASSSFLFTSAAGSAAFKSKLAEITPLGGGIHVTRSSFVDRASAPAVLRDHVRRGRLIAAAVGPSARLGPPVDTLMSEPLPARSQTGHADVLLIARTGASSHVRRLEGAGDGAWIADSVAGHLRLSPGDRIVIGPSPFATSSTPPAALRVGAVYRALWKSVANDYWVNFSRAIYPAGVDPVLPPTFVLLPRAELLPTYLGLGGRYLVERWELPLEPGGMTLDRARGLGSRFAAVERALSDPGSSLSQALGCTGGGAFQRSRCSASSSLTSAIELADQSASAVAAPSRLLGGVGLLIALGAAAAVGVFLVTRRSAEMRYRFARGESAAAFALRTGVEIALPTAVGAAAGFGLTVLLVNLFEPSASLDPNGLLQAGGAGAVALAAGVLLAAGAATVSFLRLFETAPRLRRLRLLPWELVAIGGGIYLLVAVRGDSGLTGGDSSGAGHPSLLVFALPLLLLAGVTGGVLRVVRRALRRSGGGLPVAGYLALRRAAAGSGLLVALTVLCAVSLGVLFYGQALTASLEHGTRQKALIAVGGDVQGTIDPGAPMPKLPFPATQVQVAYGAASIDSVTGPQVDVMEVDPATLGPAMHWDAAWGPPPATFLDRLARPAGGRLPVVVTQEFGQRRAIWLSGVRVPIEIVATVRAFPAMSADQPLVVTSAAALRTVAGGGGYDPLSGLALVWARGPVRDVQRALAASSLRPQYFVSVDDVLHDPDVAAAKRTFSLLTALGVGVAGLSLVGVALYLYARQRSQSIASALARRMGLTRRAEVASLWLEVAGILLVSAGLAAAVGLAAAAPVIARTDPLPRYRPAPSFVVPWAVVAATFALLLVAALVAAVATSVAARRTNVAEELRLV